MKKIIALLTALLITSAVFAVEVGKPAPDFTGKDINGKTIKLSDYKGKIVVLESYNSDCPFCKNHYQTGAAQELQKTMTDKGVVWLMVNSVGPKNPSHRTPAEAQAEWTNLKIAATAWIDDTDGTIGHLYDMKTTPHMFVIAADGTLAYDGAMDNNPKPFGDPRKAKNYVSAAVDELLASKTVTVSATKPYGCSVHYAN
jgi:peroxiredoxin